MSTNYHKLYERVGKLNGWDFSKVKYDTVGVKWDFYSEVQKRCNKNTLLLDIGTGGGEKLLKFAPSVRLAVGIDHACGMIETAHKNLIKSNKKNVRMLLMDANKLKFPDNFFDVVSDRHCVFSPKEVHRVLRKGGYFLTQQVGEGDKINIIKEFRRGFDLKKKKSLLDYYLEEMKKVGFGNIFWDKFNAKEWYKTEDDLIFLLRNTPIIPDFGKHERDYEILANFVRKNKTKKGILTNSSRYLIVAMK